MGNIQARQEWKKQKNSSLFRKLKPQQQRMAKHIFVSFISLGIATALTVLVLSAFMKFSHENNLKEIAQEIKQNAGHATVPGAQVAVVLSSHKPTNKLVGIADRLLQKQNISINEENQLLAWRNPSTD